MLTTSMQEVPKVSAPRESVLRGQGAGSPRARSKEVKDVYRPASNDVRQEAASTLPGGTDARREGIFRNVLGQATGGYAKTHGGTSSMDFELCGLASGSRFLEENPRGPYEKAL